MWPRRGLSRTCLRRANLAGVAHPGEKEPDGVSASRCDVERNAPIGAAETSDFERSRPRRIGDDEWPWLPSGLEATTAIWREQSQPERRCEWLRWAIGEGNDDERALEWRRICRAGPAGAALDAHGIAFRFRNQLIAREIDHCWACLSDTGRAAQRQKQECNSLPHAMRLRST